MERNELEKFYNQLNEELAKDDENPKRFNIQNGVNTSATSPVAYRAAMNTEKDKLVDDCNKKIILNLYCHILPLDQNYIQGHMGQMTSDVDNMLNNKGVTATQYLTDAYKKTEAPLLEYILRSTKNIGKQFVEEAEEKLKDAQENDIPIETPEADSNSEEIEGQIVDIQSDEEYETFVDKLKEKTINKIVNDVTNIINDKKEENDMTFNPTPTTESVSSVAAGLNYIQYKLIKEHVEIDNSRMDEIMGYAIREATLNEIDHVFGMISDDRLFERKIRMGKGSVITESVIQSFMEEDMSTKKDDTEIKKRYEPLYKEVDGNKFDIANHEKVDKDGNKTRMTDDEAKKVLDSDGYKNYKKESALL